MAQQHRAPGADLADCVRLEGDASVAELPLRRCLVDRFGWAPDSAELITSDARRRLEAERQIWVDSVVREIRSKADSIEAVKTARLAAERERVRAQRERVRAAGLTVIAGDRGRRLFFLNTDLCPDLHATAQADRVYFWNWQEADAAGFRGSLLPHCKVIPPGGYW